MEKTIKEWLEELNLVCIANERCESLVDALNEGFAWINSPQGNVFWHEIKKSIKNGTYYDTQH
jgi:hypothetical protein